MGHEPRLVTPVASTERLGRSTWISPVFFATVENVHHGIYRVDVFKGQVLKGSQFYANEYLARRFASTVNKRR